MDLQLFLALNAMTVSALVIAVTLIYRTKNNPDWLTANGPWLGVNAAVLAVGGAALYLMPNLAGWLVALVFLPFVAAPVVLFTRSQRQALAGHPLQAARLARWAATLHPTMANRVNAKIAWALVGDDDSNIKALAEVAATVPGEYRPLVRVQSALVQRDWSEILALAGARAPGDPAMKPLEIRALAETGRTDTMVQCYMACRGILSGASAATTKVVVLAFGGRPDGVAALLSRQLRSMDDDVKAFWTGLGQLKSASNSELGERALAKLAAETSDNKVRLRAKLQLEAFASAPPRAPSAATRMDLDALEGQVLQDASAPRPTFMTLPVTLSLITLNIIAFAAEMGLGGSEDSDTLISLGALTPQAVLDQGEWWRLLTATFLHAGPIHLGSNMFVLWVLGRLLEPLLGSVRTLAIYILGGVGSSAFVLWLIGMGFVDYELLVGASGAIFALLGAEASIVLLRWWRDPEHFDTRQLTTLAIILGLQVAIDLSVPNVSFAAHASGFLTGLLVTLLWPARPANGHPVDPHSGAQS